MKKEYVVMVIALTLIAIAQAVIVSSLTSQLITAIQPHDQVALWSIVACVMIIVLMWLMLFYGEGIVKRIKRCRTK